MKFALGDYALSALLSVIILPLSTKLSLKYHSIIRLIANKISYYHTFTHIIAQFHSNTSVAI